MLQECLDVVFPPFCVTCNRVGRQLCPLHLNDLCWNYTQPACDWIFSAVEYRDSAQDIVKLVKYGFAYRYIGLMARLIALRFPDFPQKNNIECLIPIPLHRRRQGWRGFNQAQLLAEYLGKLWTVPVDSRSLIRQSYARSQASQDRDGRKKISHSFQLTRPLRHQKVCLIDDVVTTGSTLRACREAIGTQPVLGLTFACER